jgi:hypothetical protein
MSLILNGDTGISAVDGTASVPALVGNDTNTGIYFPAADTIGFSEGGVQVGEFDSSANFKFNSGYGSVATAYGCRAWVNFNGTGTVAIRASGNVSSITDNGTGLYTVNFTNAFVDANYCVSLAGAGNTASSDARQTIVMNGSTAGASVKTTTALQILCGVTSSAVVNDVAEVNVACFR